MSNAGFVAGLVLVLGLGAAVAIPNFHTRGGCSNETAAIATLRNLCSVQAQFQAGGTCDLDGDGVGEFGTFGEMTAADGVRTDSAGGKRGPALEVPVLSAALANVDDLGIVTKSGHCFRIFLPGAGGRGVHEGKANATPASPFSGPIDMNGAEACWDAYAWPVAHGSSGTRAFFVDQGGDVWWTANKDGRYAGLGRGPAWDAALPSDGRPGWSPAPDAKEHVGRDGNVWRRTD